MGSDRRSDRRVLVLGARLSTPGVEAAEWSDHNSPNHMIWPADHDALDDYSVVVAVGDGRSLQFEGSRRQELARFLGNPASHLLVIGPLPNPQELIPNCGTRTLAEGRRIIVTSSDFSDWYGRVERYEAFVAPPPDQGKCKWFKQNVNLAADVEVHATTPSGEALGFQVTFSVGGSDRSGTVSLLPATTKGDLEDNLDALLRQEYLTDQVGTPPDWLDERYRAPGQEAAEEAKADAARQVEDAQDNLTTATAQLAAASRPRGLLYEQGPELENLVVEALCLLGGELLEAPTKADHDGIIRVPDDNIYVLEVKGVSGPMKLTHARQLEHWVADVRYHRESNSYPGAVGILVGNPFSAADPQGRDVESLPSNVAAYMTDHGQRWMSTVELFEALPLAGKSADLEEWWNSIAHPEEGQSRIMRASKE